MFTGWDVFATSLDMFVHVLATHDTSCKWLHLLCWLLQVVEVTRASYVIAIFTMCESTEQSICIKFCFKIGKTETETYQLLQQAFSEDAVGRTQVFDWFRLFKERRTSVEIDLRSGRPSTSRNEEMIAKVRTIVRNNRRLTV